MSLETIKLNESVLDKLGNLEEKSKKNIEKNTLAYEIGENKDKNEVFYQMSRNEIIEKESITFIEKTMNELLKNSKNEKLKYILQELKNS